MFHYHKELEYIRTFMPIHLWNRKNSSGQCFRTSYLLHKLYGGIIRGGGCHTGGFKREIGFWSHHFWLELEGHVVDLTADQFNDDYPVVFINPIGSDLYKHNFPLERIETHVKIMAVEVDGKIEFFREKLRQFKDIE